MSPTQVQMVEEVINDFDKRTFHRIRKAIGILGVSLPVTLLVFSLTDFFKTVPQESISHYYYTNLREIFTGTLCAVGLFLILYKGHHNKKWWRNDKLLTNICGAMAFGVAIVPTNPDLHEQKLYTLIPYDAQWIGWLHYGFAAGLFLTFSILAIGAFTIGQKAELGTEESWLNENKIYRACGISILAFIIMVPVSMQLNLFSYSTFTFEALALFAFGIAWLIKGRALGDKGILGEKIYREQNGSA